MEYLNEYMHNIIKYINYLAFFLKLLSYISLFVLLYIYLNKDIYNITSNFGYLNVSYLFGLFGLFNVVSLIYKPKSFLFTLFSFPFTSSLPFLGIKLFFLEYFKQDSIVLKSFLSVSRIWKAEEKMNYVLSFLSAQNKTLSTDEINKLVNENITLTNLKKKMISVIHANENKSMELERLIYSSTTKQSEVQENIQQLNSLYMELKSKYNNIALEVNNNNADNIPSYLGFTDITNLYKFLIFGILVLLGVGSIMLIMNYLFFNNSIWNNMLKFLYSQNKQDVVSVNLHNSNMRTTELSMGALDELTDKLSTTMNEQDKIKDILTITKTLHEKTSANVEKLETGLNTLIQQHNELNIKTGDAVQHILDQLNILDNLMSEQMLNVHNISRIISGTFSDDVILLLKTISISGIPNLDEEGIQLLLKIISIICSISKTEEGKQSLIKYINSLNEINVKP